MRVVAIALLIVLSSNVFGQKKDEVAWPNIKVDKETNLITYTDVQEVSGAVATDLYDRTMEWIKTYYKNYAEKLRKNDRDAGEIEVFARFPIYAYDKKGVKTTSSQGLVQYTLKLTFKDGRYKYVITDLNHKSASYQPLEKWLDRADPDATNHAYYLTDVDAELKGLISEMKKAIATKPGAKADEW